MGHENFEPGQEALAENGEGEIDVVKEGDVEGEETVVPETPETTDEGEVFDPESFKGVAEAPLEEDEE